MKTDPKETARLKRTAQAAKWAQAKQDRYAKCQLLISERKAAEVNAEPPVEGMTRREIDAMYAAADAAAQREMRGDGVDRGSAKLSRRADVALKVWREANPRDAALEIAEGYARAANSAKANAGSKALDRIKAGADAEAVLAEMRAEWTAAANRAVDNA